MKLSQRFFGQEHYEKGTPERDFCQSLFRMKPQMLQYGFSERDVIPELPDDKSGIVQVKYNGMLSVILWNKERERFVAWSPRGRSYFSLDSNHEHPVTQYFDQNLTDYQNIAFIGETYVVRLIREKAHMTEFNKSMSIIKKPSSAQDVSRIRLALFDFAYTNEVAQLDSRGTVIERFSALKNDFSLPEGSDNGIVHLADHLIFSDPLSSHQQQIQSFWNEFITERGFEGLVLVLDDGNTYKLKYRDTLDVVIIAFRIPERTLKLRPVCDTCRTRFDAFWLKQLAREGKINPEDWFKDSIRLHKGTGTWDMYAKDLKSCPLCGSTITLTDGPILGAKIALMTKAREFVDIADGSQIPPSSPILELIEPLYEADGYLWVKPEIVIEVAYQDLYVDRMRPLLRFDDQAYEKIGTTKAVSLRPFGVTYRPDKTVNPEDLRLEQLSYFVKRAQRIQQLWEKDEKYRKSSLDKWL